MSRDPLLLPGALGDPRFDLAHEPEETGDLQLQRYFHLLLAGKWLVFATLLVSIAVGYLYLQRAKPVYRATASVLIEDKANPAAAAGFALGNALASSGLATEIQLMTSRTQIEKVVDSLGLRFQVVNSRLSRSTLFRWVHVPRDAMAAEYRIARDGSRFSVSRSGSSRVLATVGVGETVTLPDGTAFAIDTAAARQSDIRFRVADFRSAVSAARSATQVIPARDATILSISYTSHDPALAEIVPNAIAGAYIATRRHDKKSRAAATVAFLNQQLDTLKTQLVLAEETFARYREKSHVFFDPQALASAELGQRMGIESDIASIEYEQQVATSLLREMQDGRGSPEDLSPYRRAAAFPGLAGNAAASVVFAEINRVEQDRASLLMRRTPDDPDVQDLTKRLVDLEGRLAIMTGAYLAQLNTRLASRKAELKSFPDRTEQIPRWMVEVSRLQREQQWVLQVVGSVQQRLKEAEVAAAVDDQSIRVLDAAILPRSPISPNGPRTLVLSVAIGLLLGLMAIVVREGLDRTLHSREDVQRLARVPMLGLIPAIGANQRFAGGTFSLRNLLPAISASQPSAIAPPAKVADIASSIDSRLIAGTDPGNPQTEAYRTLRTNITFASPDAQPKSLVFTSPLPGDGKTTTSANLAITFAQQGRSVLLVDADLRRGLVNSLFNVPRQPGLSNVLLGMTDISDAVRVVDVGSETRINLLPTGTLPPNPAELLGSQRMRDLLVVLEAKYDIVIFDSPPLNIVTDGAVLGRLTDGVILLARAGTTTNDALTLAIELLHSARARVIGTVLNDVDFRRDGRYSNAYGYAYTHQYAYGKSEKRG
jgi:capsular exopolysaccharide synthesis family protein